MGGIEPVLFIVFGLITLGSALLVATRRNIFHSALFLKLFHLSSFVLRQYPGQNMINTHLAGHRRCRTPVISGNHD